MRSPPRAAAPSPCDIGHHWFGGIARALPAGLFRAWLGPPAIATPGSRPPASLPRRVSRHPFREDDTDSRQWWWSTGGVGPDAMKQQQGLVPGAFVLL